MKKCETCGECSNFIGGGDWNLCCKIKYDLCYKDTPACDKAVPKDEVNEEMVP